LAERELGKWCDGHTTTPQLIQLCRDAMEDGLNQPILQRLSCRKNGKVRFNRRRPIGGLRDVMKVLDHPSITKFVVALDQGPIKHFVKPSMVMDSILQSSPGKFQMLFGAHTFKLVKFWDGFRSSPIGREMCATNPMLASQTPETFSRCIPIVIHEDAGPYAKGHSMNIINFSALLAKGPEHNTKILVATHLSDEKTKAANFTFFWDAIIQDFDELALHDKLIGPDGQMWRAILIFGKGDMEMRMGTWGLPGWSHGVDVCPHCLANRDTRPYTDNRPNAAWRPTGIQSMPNSFFLERLSVPRHPLTISHYFSKYFAVLDVMHVMDCKGVTAHVAGSILRYLVIRCMELGPNQQERLNKLNADMTSFQSNHRTPVRMPDIRLDNLLGKDGWACLGSQLVKAANTRNLVPW